MFSFLFHQSFGKALGLSILCLLLGVSLVGRVLHADAPRLSNRYLKIGDSQVSATTMYDFGFQPTTPDTLATIVLQICSNNPFPGTNCTLPAGLDVSHATLSSQSGDTGFSIDPRTTANELVLNRSPSPAREAPDDYTFSGVVNPSAIGSYYVRFQTFAGNSITGTPTNIGGVAFAIDSAVGVQATVPPYLLFCVGVTIGGYDCKNVSGNYVNFGEFSSTLASQGDTQMLAQTNAKDGYTIRVAGTTLTSGNNIIPAMSNDVSRPGVSQFGLNLRGNSTPQGGADPSGQGGGTAAPAYDKVNYYQFNSGDVVASSRSADYARKYTATYVVNVAKNQAPGVYVSTLTYIALGSF